VYKPPGIHLSTTRYDYYRNYINPSIKTTVGAKPAANHAGLVIQESTKHDKKLISR